MNLKKQSLYCLLYLFTSSVKAQFYHENDYVALVAGGERRKDVYLMTKTDSSNFNGYNCSTILPDLPDVVKGGSALPYKSKDGPPMVCGGVGQGSRKISKTCYLYNKDSNTWGPGPEMYEARFGATAVPLPDGNTWIFGGKRAKKAEMFDAISGQFQPGPDMPFLGSVRPCANYELLPDGNKIYLLGRPSKSAENNTMYQLSLDSGTFSFVSTMPGKAHAMECNMDQSFFPEGTSFVYIASGGYWRKLNETQNTAYIYNGETGQWETHPNALDEFPKVVGSAFLQNYVYKERQGTFPYFSVVIDGFDVETRGNSRFGGTLLAAIEDTNGFSPYMHTEARFPYSISADINKTKARKFPAAMWVHPSQVCTKL